MAIYVVHKAAYDRYSSVGSNLKTYLEDLNSNMESGPVSGNALSQLLERMISDKSAMTEISTVSGIAAYIANIEGRTQLDVTTGFTSFMAAIDACGAYLIANINTDNWVTYSSSGVATKTFSVAATTALRTLVQSIIDQIE